MVDGSDCFGTDISRPMLLSLLPLNPTIKPSKTLENFAIQNRSWLLASTQLRTKSAPTKKKKKPPLSSHTKIRSEVFFFCFFYWFYCVSMFSLQSVQCVHETQLSSSLEGNRCERWDRGDGSTARNEEFLQRLRSFKISIWSWQSFRLTVPCAQ